VISRSASARAPACQLLTMPPGIVTESGIQVVPLPMSLGHPTGYRVDFGAFAEHIREMWEVSPNRFPAMGLGATTRQR